MQPRGSADRFRQFLRREGYSDGFRDHYLLPMAAAIWSCPMQRMLQFPLGSFVRFFHNHGLLQIDDRPQWLTVAGGARQYVERILARLDDVRLGTPVRSVSRRTTAIDGKVRVVTDSGAGFDHVVLACHSSQSLVCSPTPTATSARCSPRCHHRTAPGCTPTSR